MESLNNYYNILKILENSYDNINNIIDENSDNINVIIECMNISCHFLKLAEKINNTHYQHQIKLDKIKKEKKIDLYDYKFYPQIFLENILINSIQDLGNLLSYARIEDKQIINKHIKNISLVLKHFKSFEDIKKMFDISSKNFENAKKIYPFELIFFENLFIQNIFI